MKTSIITSPLEKNASHKWWNKDLEKVFKILDSSKDGLSEEEAIKRKNIFGSNILAKEARFGAFKLLYSQIKNWLVITLIISSVISFFLGNQVESIVTISLVLLSVFFGFFQEYKAEKTIKKLRKLINRKVKVKRSGVWKIIPVEDLVPGDIVEIRIGDRIPADIRLFDSDNLSYLFLRAQ